MAISCGSISSSAPATASSGSSSTAAATSTGPYTLTVTASPSSVSVGGTSTISATVKDSAGANATDGTQVTWAVNDTTLGTITTSSTTSSGIATATFTAATTKAGIATVTATAGTSYTGSTNVTVAASPAGSIVFTSATPSIIGLKGSGQTETSSVIFALKDVNGNAVLDGQKVDVCMKSGPSGGRLPSAGGEYIGEAGTVKETFTDADANSCYDYGETFTDSNANGIYDSPMYYQTSTVSGNATVPLHSGKVAGNVTLLATVVGKSLSTSSSTISVGGGVPALKGFSTALSQWDITYLTLGSTITLTTYLADRFGNANILAGTTINYYTNAGALLSSTSVLDSTGGTTVSWRSQEPRPPLSMPAINADDATVLTTLNTKYGTPTTINPRQGSATVLVTFVGEEDFTDSNGNGLFDTGEPFTDTTPEPWLDFDGNGAWSSGGATPALMEYYVDVNGDGAYNGTVNGTWDASKLLFKNVTFTYSGTPSYVILKDAAVNGALPSTAAFNIATSQSFTLLVADPYLNTLSKGTVITITASRGTLTGTSSYTIPVNAGSITRNANTGKAAYSGPTELSFTITTSTAVATASTITVKVTNEGVDYYTVWYGTIN